MHKKKDEVKDDFKYSGPLRPYKVTKRLTIPEEIAMPDWSHSGFPKEEQLSQY
jgi:hypothetical protein